MQPDNQDQPAERRSVRVVTPEQFLKLLRDLPPATEDKGAAAGASEDHKKEKCRPATADEVRHLLARPRLRTGDVVRLLPFAAPRFRWPGPTDECIVTQVLDEPHRSGEHATPQTAERLDIALAFTNSDGLLVECLYDSRCFERMGSVVNNDIVDPDWNPRAPPR